MTKTNITPEGSLKAWSVVLGAWCAMSTHQLRDYSESSIGWVFGTYTFFLFVGGAQFGAVLDAHGPLYVIVPGSIGMVLSLIFLSFSQEYYQIFLPFGVLGGISASTLFTHPPGRGWATGIACNAGGVGGVIFPLVIMYAAPVVGFAWSMRIIAPIGAVPCSVACLTVRTRLPPARKRPHHHHNHPSSLDFKALSDIKYASATLAVFLVEFAVLVPITYITSYALHTGFSETVSYAVLVFLNVGAVFGRFLPGLVADRWGRFNVMAVNCLMCSLLTLILWLCGGLVLVAIPIAGAIQQHIGNGQQDYRLIVLGGALYLSVTDAFLVSRGICTGWSLKTRF
ncbi:major facilitator superfamily domain-containing protein [Aspergillus pseudoustus]|uniref:Major facilitator superfamily domain-containing protein n=1 Tax=Aspergillus pseudoustus TaxID=1810923 RepID=A0ABR4JDR4_9EURO